jgi:putative Se/S carrier protein
MEQYGYITFKSVSYAMKFETAIKKFNIKIKIIPVPRSISSSCGLCVRFDIADNNELQNIINMHKLEYSRIYTEI